MTDDCGIVIPTDTYVPVGGDIRREAANAMDRAFSDAWQKPTQPSRTPDLDRIAQAALAAGETIDNATGPSIPVGPTALGEPGGPQTRSLYLYDNLGVPWNRGYLMTTALGASAREALAQPIEADAANGDGPFVIVRFMNRLPLVAKGQFSADIGGGTLLELERAGVLWSDRREADNRLKTFYLSSDSRQLLEAAIAAAGEPTPLLARAPQPPGEGRGGQPRTGPQPRRPGRPKGTRSVTRDQIIDVFRSLRTNYGRAPTQAQLAANLNPRIELRTLQAHLTDYGLPWPIE